MLEKWTQRLTFAKDVTLLLGAVLMFNSLSIASDVFEELRRR